MNDIEIERNAEATAALMAIQAAWAARMARAHLEFLADLKAVALDREAGQRR
jgi:hypothetical protein